MSNLNAILMVFHVLLAMSLIGLILIQHGKGADAGAAFGSGASATVFGSRGSASFLTKITTILAIVFFANSLALAYLSSRQPTEESLIDRLQASAPAETGSAATAESAFSEVSETSVSSDSAVVGTADDSAAESK